MAADTGARGHRTVQLAVLVAALGYFVDIYDLILFSVVRTPSLRGLGVPAAEVLPRGVFILNLQMIGMLLGGIFWGVLGDRRGRLSVLFGSIILYSLANLANAVPDRIAVLLGGTAAPGPGLDAIEVYGAIRFIAGIGLAGELGAGITLVSESMRRETRGLGTTVVATVGICGAIAAVIVAQAADWRVAYAIGGALGLALLGLRLGVLESGMFAGLTGQKVVRGNFLSLFTSRERAKRYISVVLVGVPIWYVVGILITVSPELGTAMGLTPAPTGANAVLAVYSGLVLGDFGSGFLSQVLRTRKKVLLGFIIGTGVGMLAYFTVGRTSLFAFYAVCVFLGVTTGYWAVFVTVASEQFGTNIRATVTTTAPNFVRGSLVLVNMAFVAMRGPLGITWAVIVVGAGTLVIALVSLLGLPETYGKDLDYVEPAT